MGKLRRVNRILVVLLSPIGDTLFATPVLHALREAFPHAYIAVLLFPSNRGILEGNSDVDELIVYPTMQQWFGLRYFLGLYWGLRARHFDLSVDLSTFTYWLTRLVAGIPQRVRLRFPPLWWLLPDQDPTWKKVHAVYRYLEVLRPLGIEVLEPRLQLTVSDADRAFAEAYLLDQGVTAGTRVVALHPGGEGFRGLKRWPRKRFAALADELVRRYGAKVVLLGGADEVELASAVAGAMVEKAINAAGHTTLKQTAAIMERCELFIGNDSCPMHIAAAVGTPVVAIYGPSNPWNYHPFGAQHVIVSADLPCQPCFHLVGAVPLWGYSHCRNARCLEPISVDRVLAVAGRLLSHKVPTEGVLKV